MPPQVGETSLDREATTRGQRVLVADDHEINRHLLSAMLRRAGYEVLLAGDGTEAVRLFEERRPDLVLMDLMMPGVDGREATARIKALAGEDLVPVIILTASHDEAALTEGLDAGADDFLTKPVSHAVLRARVESHLRRRTLYRTVVRQRDELRPQRESLLLEQERAAAVIHNMLDFRGLDAFGARAVTSPSAICNGDLIHAVRTPSGEIHFLLADFSGHGMPAAIGTVPVASTFQAMTKKGIALREIIAELNRKVADTLPAGMFCAAVLVSLSADRRRVEVWNAGMPDLLVHRAGRGLVHRVGSQALPLGLRRHGELPRPEIIGLAEQDRVFVYTDGVIEGVDEAGEMFGQERLESCLGADGEVDSHFDELLRRFQAFRGSAQQADDYALLEISGSAAGTVTFFEEKAQKVAPERAPTEWRFSLSLGASGLKQVDPLPVLMHALGEVQGMHQHRELIYTVLAELYSNGLDHGVLGLDSAIKDQPEGFALYYKQREARLAALCDGRVDIDLAHRPGEAGGELTIRVTDSGGGFDHTRTLERSDDAVRTCGRGVELVRTLCASLTYFGRGNAAEAVYRWSAAAPR